MPITTTTSTISDQYLTDIADAIRSKNGSSDTYTPPQMATAINALEVVEYRVTITSNGDSSDVYVYYNDTRYYTANDSFTFTPGDTMSIHLSVRNSGTVTIYEDGVTLTSASNYINYSYTLPQHSITIALSYGSAASSATITTSGGGGGGANIQELSVTPTTSNQTFNASGIDGYKPVYVSAMPSGSATGPSSLSGTSASVSTGTNTLTLTKTGVSTTPTVTAGYVSSATSSTATVTLTASVTTKAAATITPGTTSQTIASGTYLTGTQTISGDANLVAGNIKSGVPIFGVTGTYAGGGGGIGTLLATLSLGTFNTTSTQATSTGKTVSVSGINSYDALVVETSVDTVVNNRHTATIGFIWLTASSNVGTKNGGTIATAKWNSKFLSNVTTTRASTTSYGIYPYSITISSGTASIPMYIRYNSTQTGTINGAYTTRVYGLKLYDLIGG